MDEQLKKLYKEKPNLKILWSNKLIISKREFDKLICGKTISIKELHKDLKIPVNLLKKILTDDKFYNYALKISESGYMPFSVCYVLNDDLKVFNINCSKSFIKALYSLKKENLISFSDTMIKKMEKLKDNISYEKFCNKAYNDNYEVKIENNSYNIPVKYFINFLNLDDNNYDNFFEKENNYKGIKKDVFIYSLIKYYNARNILYNYIIPKKISKRCKELLSYEKIDVESINGFYSSEIEFEKNDIKKITDFEINEELKNEVLQNIPKDFSDVQKAVYIYIKLCKLFTYDEEYFIYNQDKKLEQKHLDINRLSDKNSNYNNIVCYEFNSIYAKLLQIVGIDDLILSGSIIGMYGGGHQYLNIRIGKYLISADSVTSILNGDLVNAKLNTKLNGIKCYNESTKTCEEFNEIVHDIYELVKKENSYNIKRYDSIIDIQDKIKEYEYIQKKTIVDFDTKIELLFNNMINTNLNPVDLASYVSRLRKILFSKEEIDNNIGFTIIRNNTNVKSNLSIVLVINKDNINTDLNNNTYYIYDSINGLNQISLDELNKLFNEKKYNYISNKDPKIKGVMR